MLRPLPMRHQDVCLTLVETHLPNALDLFLLVPLTLMLTALEVTEVTLALEMLALGVNVGVMLCPLLNCQPEGVERLRLAVQDPVVLLPKSLLAPSVIVRFVAVTNAGALPVVA